MLIQYNKQNIVVELNNHFNGLYVRNYTYIFNVLANAFKSTRKGKDKYYREKINGILVNLNWNIDSNKNMPGNVIYELPRTCSEKNFFLKVININLNYYENLNNVSEYEKLWKLLSLKTSGELKEFIKDNPYLQRYGERVLELSKKKESDNMIIDPIMDKNLKREEDYYEGFCAGEEEGEKRGEKQGALKKLKQMVKSFYKNGASLDLISASSGLSIEEINNIVKKN